MLATGKSLVFVFAVVAFASAQPNKAHANINEVRMNPQSIKSFDEKNFNQLLGSGIGKALDGICNISTTDVVFVLDESGSIGPDNFQTAKLFIANLTRYMDIGLGDSQSRVGLVLFEDHAEVIFDLMNYTSNDAVYYAIMNAPYGAGSTDIASGMKAAIDMFIRQYRPDVNKIMIVLTDGQDSSDVVGQHDRAVANNITTFAIGIGSDIDPVQLIQITGDPSRVFNVTNFDGLLQILNTFCHAISHNSERTCPCTPKYIWLDIAIGFDVSTGLDSAQLATIKETLEEVIDSLTVAQTGTRVSRVALFSFAGDDLNPTINIVGYLSSFNSTDEVMDAIESIKPINKADVPLRAALTTAVSIFARPDNRKNARNVFILLSSKGVDCPNGGDSELCAAAQVLIENNIEVISVQLNMGPEHTINGLGNPCYRLRTDNVHLIQQIVYGFCQINCFCNNNYQQYIPGDNQCQKMGECVQAAQSPASWDFARRRCLQDNAFLADELSGQKHAFLKQIAIHYETIPYWIGLNDKEQSGVYVWDRGTQSSATFLPNDYTNWPNATGKPNDQNGQKQCISVQRETGFILRWFNQPCNDITVTPYYICQKITCDTSNYCETP